MVGFTVIYGGKPSAAGQPARLDWLRATRALLAWLPEDILYLYRKSQMLFVGKSELELALWATEYLWRRTVTYDFPATVSQASQAQEKKNEFMPHC